MTSASISQSDAFLLEAEVVQEACYQVGQLPEVDCFKQTASLIRSLTLIKPTTFMRRINFRSIPHRPPTLFTVLLTVLLYLWMSLHNVIKANVRSCKHCSGFGITRCDLCEGHQVIWWEGKYKHVEPCPKCFGQRYVHCKKCGGLFGRSIFCHKKQGRMDLKKLEQIEKERIVDERWVGAPKWVLQTLN
eukprot:g6560.t1